MEKKTVMLFYPHLINKNGRVWDLLHITKEKNIPAYQTEPVSTIAVRKYFPKHQDSLGTLFNRFSEKQLDELKTEMIETRKKMGHDKSDHWVNQNFQRKLHQQLMALKPLLPLVKCYHETASTESNGRLRKAPCSFSNYTPNLRFQVMKSEEYYYVNTEVELNGSFFPLESFVQSSFLLESRNEYFILRYTDYKTIQWLQQMDWKAEASTLESFSENILAILEKDYPVKRNDTLEVNAIEAIVQGKVLLSEISGQFLMLTPQYDYDGFTLEGSFQDKTIMTRLGKEYTIARDKQAEQKIAQQIENLHANFKKQFNGYYYLSFDEAKKKSWFLKTIRNLLELDIQVIGMDMLSHFRYSREMPVTSLKIVKEETDFLDISFQLRFGSEEIIFSELQKVVRAGQQGLPLKDGSIALLDEEWLKKYALIVRHAVIDKKVLRIPKWLAISMEKSEETGAILHPAFKKEWWQKWQQWQSSGESTYAVPATINASLRIYQQKGYEWLRLMDEIGAGMFLADDMGLGKTLQAICFIANVIHSNPAKKVLIVCPASLMYNWKNELSKFAASINAYLYHGTERNKNIFSDDKVQVIISSYGTLRSDAALFGSYSFSLAVLDESHAIKNPSSQITRFVHTLSADRRLTLSGTPVMNNTFDLYSQLQFILPGMFGSQQFFKNEYADPIDRDGNEQRMKELQKLTAPFILRRTKEQVAKDLPPKTETILWCQMEDGQQAVYQEIKDRIKGELQATIKEQGLAKSKLQVLQGILKLRQVCNSPVLLKDSEYNCTESIKTAELMDEIVNNLSNHKALVFSQFTSMLDILSRELDKKNIPYLLLTGSTPAKERDRLVQEFNREGGEHRVFLLSLKAGNAGLNLTAADYVFLFDPWWNNAVEQQAIDRTHRIGQTKNVFAYKLICKDTVEERIIQLQQKKKELAENLVTEEEGFVKTLTEQDIEFLLS
jgi:SNF2 family DNA or RNA helicase